MEKATADRIAREIPGAEVETKGQQRGESMWLSEKVDIIGRGDDKLRLAIELAFSGMLGRNTTAAGYLIDPEKGFMVSGQSLGLIAFPSPLTSFYFSGIALQWLQSESAVHMNKPDHGGDGTNVKGWRVYSYPKGDRMFFLGIQGVWIYLGK